eukprot:m.44906 g.44906  ORF g.44906 m.44906 type:complete len:134 (-) comp11742_c0_seq2:62-463(-)
MYRQQGGFAATSAMASSASIATTSTSTTRAETTTTTRARHFVPGGNRSAGSVSPKHRQLLARRELDIVTARLSELENDVQVLEEAFGPSGVEPRFSFGLLLSSLAVVVLVLIVYIASNPTAMGLNLGPSEPAW